MTGASVRKYTMVFLAKFSSIEENPDCERRAMVCLPVKGEHS